VRQPEQISQKFRLGKELNFHISYYMQYVDQNLWA